MEYPRTVVLEDKKLFNLLKEKEDLVIEGQELTEEIILEEQKMEALDKEVQEHEKKVDTSDLMERAKTVTEEFNAITAKMDEIKKETFERMKNGVPAHLFAEYEEAKKKKEKLESQRNKIGLKIQQKKDRIIPIARKLMEPHLEDQFEDYDSVRLENGQIISTIFNHLVDFKDRFLKRKNNQVAGN